MEGIQACTSPLLRKHKDFTDSVRGCKRVGLVLIVFCVQQVVNRRLQNCTFLKVILLRSQSKKPDISWSNLHCK